MGGERSSSGDELVPFDLGRMPHVPRFIFLPEDVKSRLELSGFQSEAELGIGNLKGRIFDEGKRNIGA